MSSRNRFVRVFFTGGNGRPRYMPQELINGNLYSLDDENWPDVWGYDTPQAAQQVILKIEKREAAAKLKSQPALSNEHFDSKHLEKGKGQP